MKILVTGARGFVGRNLVASLENIRDGKDRYHKLQGLEKPEELEIVAYDRDNAPEELEKACEDCSFVFNLAGINRPKDEQEFMSGNRDFASYLLETLKKYGNKCPVMLSSSIQASLIGRYAESGYGRSKLAGEELFFAYAVETGSKVLVYRFPNIFGKWCLPNYNSVVATWCHNVAHGLPIQVNGRETELTLLYIDDLLEEMLRALNGNEHRCEWEGVTPVPNADGRYCYVPTMHQVRLGEIEDLLRAFQQEPQTRMLPDIPMGSFAAKLYSTYLSYCEPAAVPIEGNEDERGIFTELLKTHSCGQVSVNVSLPGITRGEHWHHSKWEIFIVVSGEALIQERKVGVDEEGKPYPVHEFRVSGKKLQSIAMLPGYTHNIINLSKTENLVTVMWANEAFDPSRPDTYREVVDIS